VNTESLQDRIVSTLKEGHHPTCDQLLALLNTADDVRALKLSNPRLQQILRNMVNANRIERRADRRYYVRNDPYRWYRVLDVCVVERLHPDIAEHWTQIGSMTEAEARVCVSALNELDRKVRSLKAR
jgi:hypothetical protein